MIGFKHARQVNSNLDLNGPTISTQKTIELISDSETTFTVSPALPDGSTSIDLSTLTSDFTSFASSTIYDLTTNGSFTLTMELNGAAGGPGDSAENFGVGGKGGSVRGTVVFEEGEIYKLVIGSLGVKNGPAGAVGGGGASGGSDSSKTSPTKGGAGGSGGGFTGLFKGSVSQANALLIAGGGGGGSFESDPDDDNGFNPRRKAAGGSGGGTRGGLVQPLDGNLSGTGGGQIAGGSGGSSNEGGQAVNAGSNGSALQGGAGSGFNDTGGGGGGYFGGGGGGYQASTINGSGGGGSGFIATTTDIAFAYFNEAKNTGGGSVKIIESSVNSRDRKITGIATAAFPATQSSRNTNTGGISYNWYEVGVGALSDGTNVTGTASTILTLSKTNYSDDGRKFFLRADYSNSAYGSGLTPNAVNEPFDSGVITLSIPSILSIYNQPESSTVSENISTTFVVDASSLDGLNSLFDFDWRIDGVSINTLDYLSSITRSVSNSDAFAVDYQNPISERAAVRRSTLTLSSTTAALHKIDCVIFHPNANPSSISTVEVNFDVTPPREIIQFERYDAALSTIADSGQRDIAAFGALSFRANANAQSRAITIWAPEKDVTVKITMGGGAGADRSGNKGGEGGVSVFKVTLKKNEEYQIKLGVNDTQGGGPRGGLPGGGGSSILYHQARVIAVCGGGGGAGTNAGGGDGGGVQVDGGDGDGIAGGLGGKTFGQGLLPLEGSFPIGNGTGTNLSRCTIGSYWRDQGFSSCESMGLQKYRYADGRVFADSAEIIRGYKSGIAHRNNGGIGSGNQGGAGAGAMGGNAAMSGNSGGGGGSGYGSGDIELLSSFSLQTGTQLGGNDGVGFISIEAFRNPSFSNPDPYVPNIPPKGNETTLKTVTFTVTRTTTENVSVEFSRTNGVGPDKFIFGPNSGTFTTQIEKDSLYTISAQSNVDTRSLDTQNNTLTLTDADSNPGSIIITSDIGQFTTDTTWTANW